MNNLKELLDYYDNLYYNQDQSEISDAEYDALKQQYTKEYSFVPGKASDMFSKYSHPIPIKSLSKVNDFNTLRKEMKRLAPFVIQPKLDGLTLVRYVNLSNEEIFVTRGNGKIGENVSHTAIKIKDIQNIKKKKYIVRMEAFMLKSTFQKINQHRLENDIKLFKNPRNTAAGMLRNKDSSKVQGITYMAYNIVNSSDTQSEQLKILKENNFNVVPSWEFTENQIDEAIEFVKNFNRESLDYEIDGLVIKNNEKNSLQKFGETEHHPKNAIAYKFSAQGIWTTIKEITWQAGRTGKIVPVAEIVPIELLGSTISRVTLHNSGIVKALKINKGSKVYVIKANDVIPAIIKSIPNPLNNNTFKIPNLCPVCKEKLSIQVNKNKSKSIEQLYCTNLDCKAKLVGRIIHLAKRDALDIAGLSEETAIKMINSGIQHPNSIFELEVKDIKSFPGLAEKSSKNLYTAIQNAREVSLDRFIYAASVLNIGRSVSKDIANKIKTFETFVDDINNDCLIIRTIEGVGQTIIDSLKNNLNVWKELRKFVLPIPITTNNIKTPKKILSIVVTGSFDMKRTDIKKMITDNGHKSPSSISTKTNYLMAGEKAGSKLTKAIEYNIKIIKTIEELKEILLQD